MGRPVGWMQKFTGRAAMRSPGAPSLRREVERQFWEQIATGITSEKAAEAVGVSQPVGTHQGAYPVPPYSHTLLLQRRAQPAAAVSTATGDKGGFQVNTVGIYPGRLTAAHTRGVIAGLAYLKYPACLGHGHSLLLQLLHQRVAHRSSRAKKAVAFFKISTSPRNWRFSDSSWRMRCCSAVMGLPIPLKPAYSASTWLSQRLTTLSTRPMSLQTC